MSVLELVKEPNPLLREKSAHIEEIDITIKNFMNSLFETMKKEEGIGIAAIQVGNPIRSMIVDLSDRNFPNNQTISESEKKAFFIINPEIASLSEEKIILSEGCLSIRKADGIEFVKGDVERPLSIAINYLDLDGQNKHLSVDGNKSPYHQWLARCIQHELDHLDGVLFIDKLYNSTISTIDDKSNIIAIADQFLELDK